LAKYQLTSGQLRLLELTIILPYLLIWAVALMGYLRVKAYSRAIRRSPDGLGFNTMAWGLLWLVLWLPLSSLVSNFGSQTALLHPSTQATMIWLANYSNIIILLVAFWLLYQGSRQLLKTIKRPEVVSMNIILLFVAFTAGYSALVFHDVIRQVPGVHVPATYYESDWVILLTIVLPRLFAWWFGIQAVCNIYQYRQRVKGIFYKAALDNLARGIAGVVIAVIILRCLQSLSSWLSQRSFGALLVLIYLLLIVIGSGYVLIARGAKNLQKIEEL